MKTITMEAAQRAIFEDEDFWLTPEQAEESAHDMLAATPYIVGLWLDEECADDTEPLHTFALGEALTSGERELCVPELLAVLMLQSESRAIPALHALRAKFRSAHAQQIEADARAILAEQERQLEAQAVEAAHDLLDAA